MTCGITLAFDGLRINTNAQKRAYAVLDYDQKGVTTSLRLSPHYYNTEDEVDRTVADDLVGDVDVTASRVSNLCRLHAGSLGHRIAACRPPMRVA